MSNYLPTQYQQFIHLSRYSRWLPKEKRRETWEETVSRYFNFFEEHLLENYGYNLEIDLRNELENAVLNLEVMPSMRALMTAGPALKRDNVAGYNCCYVALDRVSSFDEIMYVLMCGTGVGFSAESKYVDQLPYIHEIMEDSDTVIHVADSKQGWAKALKELLGLLYQGQVPRWDMSKVRPSGAPLKTFGGRASGPEPLDQLFRFCVKIFTEAAGRKLTTLEAHDIVCKIAEIVVVGGVRRSALISLTDLSDIRMRDAKSGKWWELEAQRALANNSAVYKQTPDMHLFMAEWKALMDSGSGERGIFSRAAAQEVVKNYVVGGRRDADYEFGTNPCSEIILRSREFCNLSEVVIRPTDTKESLTRKVRLATILGTFQSTLTNFRYLSKDFKKNCDEERLLGVSLTGIMDNDMMNNWESEALPELLRELKRRAVHTNEELAKEIGINASAAITCVKPSGTVSQLVDSASGIHTRHSKFYERTVRGDNKDPLTKFMIDAGFPHEPCVMKPDSTTVFSFPIQSSSDAVTRNDLSAVEQLEVWKVYQMNWCEHKPSVTISVRESEWMEVGAWVYKNFQHMSGVSFLPHSEHIYAQAPYQEKEGAELAELSDRMPKDVNWAGLSEYEKRDHTAGTQELACAAGSCEII